MEETKARQDNLAKLIKLAREAVEGLEGVWGVWRDDLEGMDSVTVRVTHDGNLILLITVCGQRWERWVVEGEGGGCSTFDHTSEYVYDFIRRRCECKAWEQEWWKRRSATIKDARVSARTSFTVKRKEVYRTGPDTKEEVEETWTVEVRTTPQALRDRGMVWVAYMGQTHKDVLGRDGMMRYDGYGNRYHHGDEDLQAWTDKRWRLHEVLWTLGLDTKAIQDCAHEAKEYAIKPDDILNDLQAWMNLIQA